MTAAAEPTWVLLRGLTREARHWGDFPQRLSARLGGARVIAIDLPGNGVLNQQQSPTRVEAMAEACRAGLQQRQIEAPVQVLAMSLGAMVAVAWAARHPHELRSAVLVNTSLRPFSPPQHRLRPGNWPLLLRLMASSPTERQWERAVLRLTSRHVDADAPASQSLLDDWARWRREHPVSRANALRQLWAASRYQAPERAPPVPLRLLASRCDGLVSPRCSATLAQRWGCAVAWHPTAGHDLPLDDPAWVADRIVDQTADQVAGMAGAGEAGGAAMLTMR